MSDAKRKAMEDERAKLAFDVTILLAESAAHKSRAASVSIELLHRIAKGNKTPEEAAAWLRAEDPDTDPREIAIGLTYCVDAITDYIELMIPHLTKEQAK